jgi:secondary thiamine-phosphate synthase enzyme
MFSSEINVRSTREVEFIDITSKVQEAVSASGVKEGVCLVYVPHTTAGVTINENADPSVVVDIINKLSELVPQSSSYRHTEGNAPGHIKSTLVGCSVLIPVSGGKLMLGTWQGVFFCEFDGPRQRRVIIRIF